MMQQIQLRPIEICCNFPFLVSVMHQLERRRCLTLHKWTNIRARVVRALTVRKRDILRAFESTDGPYSVHGSIEQFGHIFNIIQRPVHECWTLSWRTFIQGLRVVQTSNLPFVNLYLVEVNLSKFKNFCITAADGEDCILLRSFWSRLPLPR